DWVLYTPDGLFDAPPGATRLVHYRRHDRAQQLEQFEATHQTFQLGEQLLEGKNPRLAQETADPPSVTINVPPRPDPTVAQTRLTVTLGADDCEDVRLYHNGVPIPTGWKPRARNAPGTLTFEVPVRLLPNRNRFHVMASRAGTYDSSSPVVEVDYAGP